MTSRRGHSPCRWPTRRTDPQRSCQVDDHDPHEEAAAFALASDAAVLVREDIYEDRRGSPVDFTRTVWPGDTTRLVIGR